jgi:hypothetical protein
MRKYAVAGTMVVTCLAVLLSMSAVGWAVTDQQTLTINAAVAAKAKLTLGVAAINFADSDPDSVPSIGASENPVSVTVKAHSGSSQTVTLTVQASGDLESGVDSIPIAKVTWTASGSGFVAGTMNTLAQPAGSWTGSGQRSGTFSYFLANDWNYQTGSYTQSVVYTLSAP